MGSKPEVGTICAAVSACGRYVRRYSRDNGVREAADLTAGVGLC